jgi:coenzyme F420-reducing hydrogenase delta subunit/ferredoxin
LIALALASGVVGFWLVWDQLGQFVALASAEWLDVLPLFSEPLTRNFFSPGGVTDRFFTLAMFMHLGLPLTLLFLAWVHLQRISRPVVHPPRPLALGSLTALLVLALVKPVTSHAPADLTSVPGQLKFDWFYLFLFPAVYAWSPAGVWALAGAAALFLLLLPLLSSSRRAPVAQVSLAHCNGCGRCSEDCPYCAVVLRPRSDGRRAPREAVVLPELCAGCGICAGACPSSTPFRSATSLVSGIDMPQLPIGTLRARLETAVAALEGRPRIVIFGCDWGVDVERLREPGTAALRLLCAGMLPPSFIEYALRGGADGVLVTGCRAGDCAFRLGDRWAEERLHGQREPHLRRNVPAERLRVFWAGPRDFHRLADELERFRAHLTTLAAPRRTLEQGLDRRRDGVFPS